MGISLPEKTVFLLEQSQDEGDNKFQNQNNSKFFLLPISFRRLIIVSKLGNTILKLKCNLISTARYS